jgi:hypothetical protein
MALGMLENGSMQLILPFKATMRLPMAENMPIRAYVSGVRAAMRNSP